MPYMLNGEMLDIATEPKLMEGTLFVPLRKLAVALGGSADYEPTNGIAILYLGSDIVTFSRDSKTADVNGTQTELPTEIVVEDGETWVPVRFFERSLGYTLSADPQNGIVDLSKS